jgi:hypothetical protein
MLSPSSVFHGNIESSNACVVGGSTFGGGLFGPNLAQVTPRQVPQVQRNEEQQNEALEVKKQGLSLFVS